MSDGGRDGVRSAAGGLAWLEALARGEVEPPPAARLVGLSLVEVERGRAVFALEPQARHYNPMGVVHGGIISTILDTAMGCAVQSMLPAGTGYTTTDLHVTFVRAITEATGRVTAEGRSLHAGGRLATADGRLTDATGRLLAHAVTSCFVMPATTQRHG